MGMTRYTAPAASTQNWGGWEQGVSSGSVSPGHIAPCRARVAVLTMAASSARERLASALEAMRWRVQQVEGAAGLFAFLENEPACVAVLDSWLPDLDAQECVELLASAYPMLDVLASAPSELRTRAPRGLYRNEILHALRELEGAELEEEATEPVRCANSSVAGLPQSVDDSETSFAATIPAALRPVPDELLPEFLGTSPATREVCRRIRLVANRRTPVLVHGPSGTGKELVAHALHRLSGRATAPFAVINCAAIPEALVEAELFGHAKGAFTGAQTARVGRIEAAAGGTVFLDEIGELPLPAQGKLLRFLASGEIQRVGDNETSIVDTRVIAATHRPLGSMTRDGSFRLDLLHRLSVFLIQTPSLAERPQDLEVLIARTLEMLGREEPGKKLTEAARQRLHAHTWPGNVRELEHALERAWILAGESTQIDADCIEFHDFLES